ncbi:contractile injection system protein, VgrG/Pvc8 family [Rahnella inusitata]|uniref:contractile injection system protein, VgrG/Pvc8 family n=1 Tax=Rahnella inusitata TaxID=58169 RepID=UPI0039B11E3D
MLTDVQLPAGARIAPAFTLKIKNKVLEQSVTDRIISLTVNDKSGFAADDLTLKFDDADGQLQMPARGTLLHLHIGWSKQALYDCGYFIVDTVTHQGSPDIVIVTARSADFRGTFETKRSQSYDDYTLGAIVRILSARNNLSLPFIAPELDSIKIPHIDQTDENDGYFLTRLAQNYGAQATVKNGAIIFFKPYSARSASGQTLPWKTLVRSDGDEHIFKVIDQKAYSGVIAQSYDVKTAATSSVALKRIPSANPASQKQHPLAIKTAGAESEKTPPLKSYTAGSGENVLKLPKIYPDEESAMRAADSVFNQIQADSASFSIRLAMGRADLSAQTPLNVQGFKNVVDDQSWIIDSVEHSLNEKGFTTKLNLKIYVADITYQSSISQP